MVQSDESDKSMRSVTSMVEIIVRLAAIAALTFWCFDIISPFVGPVCGESSSRWLRLLSLRA